MNIRASGPFEVRITPRPPGELQAISRGQVLALRTASGTMRRGAPTLSVSD